MQQNNNWLAAKGQKHIGYRLLAKKRSTPSPQWWVSAVSKKQSLNKKGCMHIGCGCIFRSHQKTSDIVTLAKYRMQENPNSCLPGKGQHNRLPKLSNFPLMSARCLRQCTCLYLPATKVARRWSSAEEIITVRVTKLFKAKTDWSIFHIKEITCE